ncbi:MAG: WYL domain-containing protein [Nitrospira sp.]|nr:WYL domain-containing protein [Nitrospira sp.]
MTFKYGHYILASMNVNEITFVIFDFETTGMSPVYGDDICEIGAVKVREKTTLGQFDTLINPQRPISPGAMAVNGITDEMVADAPLIRDVLPEFLKFIEGAVLVAHNVQFDAGFLAAAVYERGLPPPTNSLVDTLALSRKLYKQYSRHSLDELRRRFRIFYPGAHRGLSDSLTTRDVLWIFLDEIKNRHGEEFEHILKYHGPPYVFPTQMDLSLKAVRKASREGAVRNIGAIQEPLPLYHPELLETLEIALREGRSLLMEYAQEGQERLSRRMIDPYFVMQRGQYCYLRAYCHLRQDTRTFRLDRVNRLYLTEYTFARISH